MTLREKQSRFVAMTNLLIAYAQLQGYELTFGDAFRYPDCPYGHKRSLHKMRLAIDLNVFKEGEYLNGTGQFNDLGEFWEHIGGSWGGRIEVKKGIFDDNHFSLTHAGMV